MCKMREWRVSLRPTFHLLLILFALTGFTGLVIEQCFEKLLTAQVGASTPAAAIVLSAYFLGLTSGALLYPRLRRFARVPLRTYGFLELGVSAWALLLALGYPFLISLFSPLLGWASGHAALLAGLRFVVACCWILPPTMLMGATFPAMVDGLEAARFPEPRRMMTLFYSMNILGAILGAFAGPFFLFPDLGIVLTLVACACIDCGVAGLVLNSLRTHPWLGGSWRGADGGVEAFRWAGARVLLVVGFLSGFVFFSLEVLWAHLIGAVLGNSVYAFAGMLFFVLIGLWLGGFLSTVAFKERKPVSTFVTSLLFVLGSAVLVWQRSQWDKIPNRLIALGSELTSFPAGEALRWSQAALLLLPPSLVLGMVYPTLFRMSAFPIHRRSELASRLSGLNSIGCVLGALVTGFVLIPGLGSERTLSLLAGITLLLGAILAAVYGTNRARIAAACLVVASAVPWLGAKRWNRLALTSGGHVYFQPGQVGPGSRLLFFHEDILGGITTVVQNPVPSDRPGGPPGTLKVLLTNGKFQANDGGERYAQVGFALIPILHTRSAGDALVIGLGSGQSASIVHRYGFRTVTIAEIAPGIVQAARTHFSGINTGVLDRPNTRLVLEDGRNVMLTEDKRYDLITMEITSVWFAGSAALYSKEFYELAKRRLNVGGIFQQWIQIHHIGIDELGSVLATLRSVFPVVSFWVFGGQGILVASAEPQGLVRERLEQYAVDNPWPFMAAATVREPMLLRLLASRLLSPDEMSRLWEKNLFDLNTDQNRLLEYRTPRYNLGRAADPKDNVRFLAEFADFPPHGIQGGWPEWFAPAAQRLTPALFAKVLQLTP